MKVTQEDERDAPWKFNTATEKVEALHDSNDNPAAVGQDEGQEEICMDSVSQAPHLPFKDYLLSNYLHSVAYLK